MPKRATGRPAKLTKKVIKDITDAVSIGSPQKMAAGYAGISERTFYNWITEAEEEVERLKDLDAENDPKKRLLLQLLQSVNKARANAGVSWLNVVNNAAQGDAKWAAWMLEKKFPVDFGKQEKVDIDMTSGGNPLDEVLSRALSKAYGSEDEDNDESREAEEPG